MFNNEVYENAMNESVKSLNVAMSILKDLGYGVEENKPVERTAERVTNEDGKTVCSACGTRQGASKMHYCPHCGAKFV